jgi:glucosamine--fructose-6-phosphate aminotransferase (isomerizing)
MFTPNDAAGMEMRGLSQSLTERGARVLCTEFGRLPRLRPDRAETDAVCTIQAFYAMLVHLASRRGVDPDQPPHLQKVTRTK